MQRALKATYFQQLRRISGFAEQTRLVSLSLKSRPVGQNYIVKLNSKTNFITYFRTCKIFYRILFQERCSKPEVSPEEVQSILGLREQIVNFNSRNSRVRQVHSNFLPSNNPTEDRLVNIIIANSFIFT